MELGIQEPGRKKRPTFASSISVQNTGTGVGWWKNSFLEFEGDRKSCDVTHWDLFTDIKKEMLKRLEALASS
jgi:hypothetical protein